MTPLRRSDVVSLEHKRHVQGRHLRIVISKSEERTGKLHAARSQWKQDAHPPLAQMIERGERLAVINGHCPWSVSQKPKRRMMGKVESHPHQLLPNRLTQPFDQVRKDVGTEGHELPWQEVKVSLSDQGRAG